MTLQLDKSIKDLKTLSNNKTYVHKWMHISIQILKHGQYVKVAETLKCWEKQCCTVSQRGLRRSMLQRTLNFRHRGKKKKESTIGGWWFKLLILGIFLRTETSSENNEIREKLQRFLSIFYLPVSQYWHIMTYTTTRSNCVLFVPLFPFSRHLVLLQTKDPLLCELLNLAPRCN